MAVLVRSGARSVPLGAPRCSARPACRSRSPATSCRWPARRPSPRCCSPCAAAADVGGGRSSRRRSPTAHCCSSPLGGLDAAALRRLGRALRDAGARGSARTSSPPAAARELIREALARARAARRRSRRRDAARPDFAVTAARRLGELAADARATRSQGGASTHEVLWVLWNGDGVAAPARARRASAVVRPDVPRTATSTPSSPCSTLAARDERARRAPRAGALPRRARGPADPGRHPGRAAARAATRVRLLTAHRSKGLEWDVVVVVDVQEDVWPDLRRRGSLLAAGAARRRRAGRAAVRRRAARPRSAGCSTSPSPARGGGSSSRRSTRPRTTGSARPGSCAELGVAGRPGRRERPRRPLTLPALVAELRAVAADPDAAGAAAAAPPPTGWPAWRRARRPAGAALVPAADPDRWWGLDDLTRPATPSAPRRRPVPLSGSSLAGLERLPAALVPRPRGRRRARPAATALGFGSVVHALAPTSVARGQLPADLDALMVQVDRVWDQLAFEAPWQSESQREQARARSAGSSPGTTQRADGRELVGHRGRFSTTIRVGDRDVLLRGSMDRVELDADGRVAVVDLKTGKGKPTGAVVAEHPQLGLYQLAVAAERSTTSLARPAGRRAAPSWSSCARTRPRSPPQPSVQAKPAPDPEQPVDDELPLAVAVERMVLEDFPPTPGDRCGMCAFRASCPAQPEGRMVS